MKSSLKKLLLATCLLSSTNILWAQNRTNPTVRPAAEQASGGTSAAAGATGQAASSNCTVANDSRSARQVQTGSGSGRPTENAQPTSGTSAR
jgi:hypothetical protein